MMVLQCPGDKKAGINALSENAIRQMQMVFVPEEDRILFRVNSADSQQFRFWLTRRYIQLMLRALHTHLQSDPDVSTQATPDAKQAVQAFKQEHATQGADFKQKFDEQASAMPLGDEAILAYRLNYRMDKETLHLGIEPKAGRGISLAINRDINASLTQLINTAVSQAEWRLSAPEPLDVGGPPIVN